MNIDVDESMKCLEEDAMERERQINEDQRSLACLNTFALSQVLYHQYVYGQLSALNQNSQEWKEQIARLNEIVERQGQSLEQCVTAVAACQKETASVLNREVERHTVKPAMETVVALAEELFHLRDLIEQFCPESGPYDDLEQLKQESEVSCQVACGKLSYLDIERITPSTGDEFDPSVHAACGHVETSDSTLHSRIDKLITSGITHRGKVLRQAKVCVFRFTGVEELTKRERNTR